MMKILLTLFVLFFILENNAYSNPVKQLKCERKIITEKCGSEFLLNTNTDIESYKNLCRTFDHNKNASEEIIKSCAENFLQINQKKIKEFKLCKQRTENSIEYKNCFKDNQITFESILEPLPNRVKVLILGLILGAAIIIIYVFFKFSKFFIKLFKKDTTIKNESEQAKENQTKKKSENTFSSIFSNKKDNIEKRLAKLKQLLDDNLISKEEYEEQRKKIIGDV